MSVQQAPICARVDDCDEGDPIRRTHKILNFPELRSQSELDIAASRSTMTSKFRGALKKFPLAGLMSRAHFIALLALPFSLTATVGSTAAENASTSQVCGASFARSAVKAGDYDALCGCTHVTRRFISQLQNRRDFPLTLQNTAEQCPGLAGVLADVPTANTRTNSGDYESSGENNFGGLFGGSNPGNGGGGENPSNGGGGENPGNGGGGENPGNGGGGENPGNGGGGGDKGKDNASEHNGKGGNDGKGGKDRDGSKNSNKGRGNKK